MPLHGLYIQNADHTFSTYWYDSYRAQQNNSNIATTSNTKSTKWNNSTHHCVKFETSASNRLSYSAASWLDYMYSAD